MAGRRRKRRELTDDELIEWSRDRGKQLMWEIENRINSRGYAGSMDITAIEQAKREGTINILRSSFENRFIPNDMWEPEIMDKAIDNARESYAARVHENFERGYEKQKAEHEMYEQGLATGNGTAYPAAFVSVGPEGNKHPIPIEWLT